MSREFKKRLKVASEGGGVAVEKDPQMNCMICQKRLSESEVVSCVKCSCGKYCSDDCMNKHENHSRYCYTICSLEKLENEKRMKNEIFTKDPEKLPYKMKLNLIRLVGERPLVKMCLNGVEIVGL